MSIFGRPKPAAQPAGLHFKASPLSEEATKRLGVEPKAQPLTTTLAKLSKRERILILGLAILIAVAALVFFLVMPALSRLTELHDEIDSLNQQKSDIDTIIALDDSRRNEYELSQKDYTTYQRFLFSSLTPEDLDRSITDMLLDAGLEPLRLSMTSLVTEELSPYVQQALATRAVSQESPLPDSAQSTNRGEVSVYTLDIAADGDAQALFSFLTSVYALHGIEVLSWSFTDPPAVQFGDAHSKGTVDMQVKIYVFLGEEVK